QESSDARPQFSEARRPKAARSPAFLTSGAGARHAPEPAPHQSQPRYAVAGSSIRSADRPTRGAPAMSEMQESSDARPQFSGARRPKAARSPAFLTSGAGPAPAAEPAPHQSQPG